MMHNTIIKFVNCKLNKSICGNGCYIGKTERYLITRITEHDMKETEPMFQHLSLSLSLSLSFSLSLSLSVNCLKIIFGYIPFRHYSINMKIAL